MSNAHGCKIAHARIDERGRATGGKAGDQTGKELCITDYYKHSACGDDGWRVFRPANPEIADNIASAAEKAVRNDNIGYDQRERETLFSALENNGFDMASIAKPCECDCSSLVHACLWAAGIPIDKIFRTPQMPDALKASGEFMELGGTEYRLSGQYLLRGDVLVTPVSGHTVIVVQSGDGEMLERNRPEWRKVEAPGVWNIRETIPAESVVNPHNVIGSVRQGDIVRYYGTRGSWAGIKYANKKGYVNIKAFE